ncbi:MAG: amino acid adenylation domain-containing protein [Nitrospira sp.]
MSKKKDIESIHYLSPLQEGLLFHAVSDGAADPYFTQTGFVIDGELELGPFEQAWQKVVERHPILRTGFVWEGVKQPMQVARHGVLVPLQLLDWRAYGSRQRDEALAEFLRDDRRKPFDLLTPPMMRLTLIRIEDNRWYFINSHHHILLDGWSVALLLREVLVCYDALAQGRQPMLPSVRPYAEYLTWLGTRNLQDAEMFWRTGLAEFATPTALPLETPQRVTSEKLKSLPYAEQEVRLSKAEVETLTSAAKRSRLTLNTLVQGAWSILLHRCTGDHEVLFGATVSGRPAELPGSDVMVGLFINTLPVRVSLPPDAKLGDWLTSVQEQNSLLRQYEWTPLSRIQRWSDVPGGRPLFDSIVVFESYPEDESDTDQLGLRITPMAPHRPDADYVLTAGRNNYPLSLMVEPAAEVRLILSYARERFAHDDITRLLGYYRTLLMAMAERPDVRLAELSPLSDAERNRLLTEWNRTTVLVDGACIHQLFEQVAQEQPDAVAVVYEGQSLTYAELDARADELAGYLQKLGVGPDVRVGLCVERSLNLIVGLLGVLKAGGAYVALDPKLPRERLAFMLSDSGARVVLMQAASGDMSHNSNVRQVYLDRDWENISAEGHQPLRRDVRPENMAYVIYTSGSTGRPKGVAVEHRQVVNYVSGLLARLSLDQMASFATVSTVAADLGNTSIFGSLCSGRALHVLSVERGFDPDAVADYMAGHRIDVLKIVPSHLAGLLEAGRPERVLPRRCLILGGEAVHSNLVERIRSLAPDCEIINHYGPTETTIGVLTHLIDANADRQTAILIGRPLANSLVYILNSDGQPTPVGVSGELCIGGDGLARGYLGRPDLTAERFVPNPFGGWTGGRLYRTGDRARYRPDGTVEFQGRVDNQVKVRGFRIELGEIEAQLRGDDRLKDAVVIVRASADGTKQLAAYVAAPADLDLDSVRSRLAVHLPDYMIPSTMTVLEALPLTANGKIDRSALPDPEQAQTTRSDTYVAPRNDVEATLMQIWADVLHLDRVGIHDNFFSIGGDSILCLQVVAKAHRANVKVTPKLIFEHHTVAEIADALATANSVPSEPASKEETVPPEPFALARVDLERVQTLLAPTGRELEDLYPTSPIQQGMLFHSLRGDEDGAYHNHVVYAFTQGLDPDAFERAWQHAVDRHAILRTGFVWDVAAEPLQAVFRHATLPVEHLDWRTLDGESTRLEALREYLSADRLRGFTFDQPPLMRLALIRRTEHAWWIVWSLHHAILDGSSQALLIQEVMETYEGLRRGEVLTSKPAPSYRAYIQRLLRQDHLASERFWREYLHGVNETTRLPERATHYEAAHAPFGELRLDLPFATLRGLEQLARSNKVTLNTVIQGAWALLLARYSDADEVLFGVTVSGRPAELMGSDEILGVFINTMPLRVRITPIDRLGEWLQRVQNVNVDLRHYEATPLVQIQGWSQIPRSMSLFDSVLVFQNYLLDSAVQEYGRTFGIEAVDVEGWTNYPLTITVVPEERLAAIFSYNRHHLNDEMVEQLANHWTSILAGMIETPDARLAELSLLSDQERQHLLMNWNDTRRVHQADQCLSDLFETQAALTPERIALSDEGVDLTYREVDLRANQLAHRLMKDGVGLDVRVGICLERSTDLVIAILGVLKAGGAYVPLDPAYPSERLSYMLYDAQVAVVVTRGPLLAAVDTAEWRVIDLYDWASVGRESSDRPCVTRRAEQLAYIIYTSGSTGRPKGVMVRHAGAVNFLLAMQDIFHLSSRDVLAATTSISFDIALLEWFLPLVVGARTVMISRDIVVDGPRLAHELERIGATVMQATPSGWRSLFSAEKVPPVRVLCGGEAFPLELARTFLTEGFETWNLYGPTETTVWSMISPVANADNVVPLGRPIANTQIYLLDSAFNLVPIGVPGELYIGGEGLARGYWRQPDLTAERFVPDPFGMNPGQRLYRTGDQARYRPDGILEFLGRLDHQVKVRGYRIELGEIESALSRHPQVMRSIAVVRDEQGNKRIVAYVVPETGSDVSPDDLRRVLRDQLPDYMVPSIFVVLKEFPLTPNGKVDRKALPAPESSQSNARPSALTTPTEEILAGLWADVLSLKHVGVRDDFFELGGHSLLATQVMSRIRTAFQIELPLRSLFEAPTVEALSAVIDQARPGGDETLLTPLTAAERRKPLALSFAQQRLWFLAQMEPEGWSYNLPFALRLSGALDFAALSQSFEQVIARHETLRTTFHASDGEPVQVIDSGRGFVLPVDDLSELPDNRREEAVQEAVSVEVRRPFRLDHDRPIRARLLRLGEQEHVLLVTLHHIAADAWSMTLLANEVAVFYQAKVGQSADRADVLPPLPVQYADFANWQRQRLQGPRLDAHLAYWKQRLGVNPPVLKLPTDRPRPLVQSFRGAHHIFTVPAEHADRLRALSRKQGVTLFMTLLAGFNTLLFRTTGQEDILIGTDVANRNREETEALIGFFVNLLPLRSDLGGNPTFLELLTQVRRTALEAYAHQDLPFERIVETLKLKRDLGGNPLVQALFVLQNVPPPSMELPGLAVNALEFESEVARFDLGLFMEDAEDGLTGLWKYNRDLFDVATIAGLSERFVTLLGSITVNPESRLSAIEILSHAEKESAMIESKQREESKFKRFKHIQPKAVHLAQRTLVERRYLEADQPLPLVIQPAVEDVDLAAWGQENRGKVEEELLVHGAILFRGFSLKGAEDFEQVAQALCPTLFGEYGDLPREKAGRHLYGSTPYPADRAILFHNESSHLHRWPLKQSFFCVQASQEGGETPIVDCRKMCERLRPKLRKKFEEQALMYVRNFTPGFDVSWQDFFHTEDKSVVEQTCRQHGVELDWTSDGGLRTRQVCPAIIKHPKTGEWVFFNQIQLHHISYLEPAVRSSLVEVLGIERVPRNVYFGDGSPIEDETAAEIGELYERTSVRFPWQNGDLLMLDNMLVAHARLPFVGPRKIVVAMGEMINQGDVHTVNA